MSVFYWFVMLSLLARGGWAQQYPSQQRGLSADTAYQVGVIDNVNLFNGGLTLQIPIGPTYPVGPNLSFSLSLSYSSVGWDYEEDVECFDPVGGMQHNYDLPIESPHSNAGFGWRIVLGKIVDADTTLGALKYISGDGGEHGFYEELHPGYPAAGSQPGTTFTNDSTYLRMRYYSAAAGVCTTVTGGSADCRQIEFPNGTIHEFHDFSAVPAEPEWLVTRMMDRFDHANWVAIDYSTEDQWQISDSHGRSHTVAFSGGRISQVQLEGFDAETPEYTVTQVPTTLDRHQYLFQPPCAEPDTITAPLLTQLTLPDGTAYKMSYITTSVGTNLSGGIERLRLPTGGEFAWSYTAIDFVSQDPQLNGPDFARTAYGVDTKEIFTTFDDAGSKIGEWSYDYVSVGNPSAPGDPPIVPCFHTTTVTDPLGNTTVHYFDSADVSPWQYGLPFRRCDDVGGLLTDPFPSQEIYEGDPDSGTKLRTIFVEYGSDGVLGGLHQEKNHRLTLRKTVYHDADMDRQKQVAFSDFDGLGHFRTAVTTGDFAGTESRTVEIDYNPDNMTLVVDPDTSSTSGSTFVMPGQDDPWVLETYPKRTVAVPGDTATTEFCFDAATGFLGRTRTLAGSSQSGIDLMRVFDQEEISDHGTGRVATERSYGGDPGGLDTGDLCTLSLPEEAQSQLEHTYAFGALASSSYVDPCDGSFVLKIADHDIDGNTGLVKASRDSAGVATTFVYDALARLVRQQPQDDAWTIITYVLPDPASSDSPELTVEQCENGVTDCSDDPLAWRHTIYDGLGRLTREEIQYPAATGVATAFREMNYNAMGWKTSTSLWNATSETTDFSHDRFGRVSTVTPPDPSLAPTVFRYRGEQRIERSDKVATEADADETYICFREEYDVFGRLVSVSENLASNAAGDCSPGAVGLQTLYAYDEADRLVEVCAGGGTAGCDQQRFFTYDGRGFLTSEQHPEIGPSGDGVASYTYDASGNVLSKDISGTTGFALRYAYDPANRLIAVDEADGPDSTKPIKSFHYARTNDGTNLQAGKLVLSKRFNHVDPVGPLDPQVGGILPVIISQAYRYEGRGGRVSQRQTRYNLTGTHNAFITGFAYDDLGNLSQIDYPRCLHFPCVGLDPPRSVSYGYTGGFLSSVDGFATALTYQRGGILHQVTHANTVVETIEVDPIHPFDRPYRITTSEVTTGDWDSGIYEYDGSGNVKKIGDQLFRYDKMSRLVDGQVEVEGALKTQAMTYDAFGNILNITTDGVTLSTTVNSATNRLSDPLLAPAYDAGGNLADITLAGEHYVYTYDPLNMMKHLQSTTDQARIFLYDADDER
ncbi:MAG: RHS repeat protein, partial [Actinomycetia bacterium]|nr:RHS repeat protein [Actinomycetes bacterium]